MALSYTQIQILATNPVLYEQMCTALLKQALGKIPTATGAELALCSAIIKAPQGYATRFLLDALLLNAATLTSTSGTTLDTPPTDAAIDTAIGSMWAAQVLAGA